MMAAGMEPDAMHEPNRDTLQDVMDDSFVVVLSEWTVGRAAAFLAGAICSHVVILRVAADRRYRYLYTKAEFLRVLDMATDDEPVYQAFQLHEHMATAELPAELPAGALSPAQALVMDHQRIVGFFNDLALPIASAGDSSQRTSSLESVSAAPFEAYPALSMPESVVPEETFDIFVGFRDKADPKLEGSQPIHIEHPEPGRDCLVILSGDGVTLDKDNGLLPLKSNATLLFTGRLKSGMASGSVKAMFIYREQVMAAARREITAVGHPARGGDANKAAPRNPCRLQLPAVESAVDVTVSLECKRDGTLEWRILVAGDPKQTCTVKLETTLPDTKQFAADLVRDLRTCDFRGKFARNILDAMGQDIAACMPSEFFEVLADCHARLQRLPTLLLLTNETYVPWELAYIRNALDSSAPPYLAAQTIMGRWLEDPNIMLPPVVTLPVQRVTAVASEYGLQSGQRKLAEAMAEQKTLCDRWQAIPLGATATEMEVMVTGVKFAGHIVHFAIHGYSDPASNLQALLLADNTTLPATAMTGAHTCGETPRFSFVFLNACQVGTPGRSLGHAGGFPGYLVRGGTIGFIAPLWDVHDDVARAVAETFYEETLGAGDAVGEALSRARRGYAAESTTPLAYIYYGHPALRLTRQTRGATT